MAGLPWYAHDVPAYTRKTRNLSMEQDGAYRRMLDHYYDSEAPLPPPLKEVFCIARCTNAREQKSVTFILNAYFTLAQDGWHNERADEELAKRKELSAKRSNAGANGVAKRKQLHKQKHKQTPEQNGSNCSHIEHSTGLETSVSKQSADAPFVLPDWVPKPLWDEFIKSRKNQRAAPTDHAKTLLIKDLVTLQEQGFTPTEILEAAIKNSWKGLFPPPSQRHVNGSGTKPTAHENLQRGTLIALERIAERQR